NADPDGDGVSNGNEYLAGTDPNNAASTLKITSITRIAPNTMLIWSAVNTRFYTIQTNNSLTGNWSDFQAQSLAGWQSSTFMDATPANQFYRIRAFRPLTP